MPPFRRSQGTDKMHLTTLYFDSTSVPVIHPKRFVPGTTQGTIAEWSSFIPATNTLTRHQLQRTPGTNPSWEAPRDEALQGHASGSLIDESQHQRSTVLKSRVLSSPRYPYIFKNWFLLTKPYGGPELESVY